MLAFNPQNLCVVSKCLVNVIMTFFVVSLTIAWVLTLNGREWREFGLFLTTEDVVMHCTCKCEYVAALLLEEKPQEMEIEVSLFCLSLFGLTGVYC